MNNKLLSGVIVFCLLSCAKENIDDIHLLNDLALGKALQYIPVENYQDNSFVVFKNQNGEEKKMKIEFNVELQDKVFEGKNYSSEYMTINLTEGNDSTYNVYVYGSANYINATEFVESVKGAVNALSLDYPTAFGISQDGEPVICSKSDEVVLLNVSFNDVYYNYKDDSLTSYSEVFYNRSIGIIGFRDKNDLLWVFARFEE